MNCIATIRYGGVQQAMLVVLKLAKKTFCRFILSPNSQYERLLVLLSFSYQTPIHPLNTPVRRRLGKKMPFSEG